MKYKISVLICINFVYALCCCQMSHSMDFVLINDDVPNHIYAYGEIEKGDTDKLKNFVAKNCKSAEEIGAMGYSGTISFNSEGGNYIEGLELGNYIFDNYFATELNSENICFSSCALAFLGGRNAGNAAWFHQKEIQPGASLGFHSFYSNSKDMISTKDGVELGKIFTNALYAYLYKIKIDPEFIIPVLFKSPDDMLYIKTPKLLKNLNIQIAKKYINMFDISPTESNIITYAINVVKSLNVNDWDIKQLKLNEISGSYLLYDMNNCAFEIEDLPDNYFIGSSKTPIKVRLASRKTKDILNVYFDLLKIKLVPDIQKPVKMYRIDGFDNVHWYISRKVYILVYNSNGKYIYRTIMTPIDEFPYHRSISFDQYTNDDTDLIYLMNDENKELW